MALWFQNLVCACVWACACVCVGVCDGVGRSGRPRVFVDEFEELTVFSQIFV